MYIEFFTTESNRSPVTDFIDTLQIKDQAVVLAVLQEISDYGFKAKGVRFKQIKKKLWEMKITVPSGGIRLFYAMISQNKLLILHGFKKKSQKTPLKQLNLAEKRLKRLL